MRKESIIPIKLKGKIKAREWWYVKCVDKYLKYHKNLTKIEEKELYSIVVEINKTRSNEKRISLYYDGIYILHNAFCRKYPNNKCVLRTILSYEEEIEHESALGVTEVYD